mgnify:FL=1
MKLGGKGVGEIVSNLQELLLGGIRQVISAVDDLVEDSLVAALAVSDEGSLESLAVLDINAIAESLDSGKESDNDLLGLVGHVLVLLEELVKADSPVKLLLGGGIKITSELSEGGDLTVLGKLKLHGTGDLLGCLVLGSGSYTGHRETDGDGRALSLVEELGLHYGMGVGEKIVG